MRLKLTISIIIGSLGLACTGTDRTAPTLPDTTLPDHDAQKQKPGIGRAFHHGVVTTSEPLAAQAGAKVLAQGGNAIDAAITAMFMLNVVEPQDSGLGGGGFMLIHLADSDETRVLDCRELSPKATTADIFVSQPDFDLRASSGYSVGVPGEVACAATALQNWGTITLAEALQPAIEAASGGIQVSSRLAADILLPKPGNQTDPNIPVEPHYDVARAVFRPGGIPLVANQQLVQNDLANTFQLIAAGGPDAFYQCGHAAGIADAIIATQQATRTGNPDGAGKMTCEDLQSYEVEFLGPIARNYRGYEIVTIPPPSSGGIALLQELAMLERFPIGDADAGFGFGQFATLNVMIEAMRLAFADRDMWVGDESCQGCFDVPVSGLLADAYLAQRADSIEVGQRRLGITAGDPRPFEPPFVDQGTLVDPNAEVLPAQPNGSTTHVSVIDDDDNIVALTMSIEQTWGTGLMVPGYGFLLNNQLTDFNPVPTFNPDPQAFNPGANDPGPEKRPRTNMAPTIVFLGGQPVAAYGSPAGAHIFNAVLSVTLNLIDHRLTLRESVKAPRISVTSALDDAVVAREDGFSVPVMLALEAIGYSFLPIPAIGAVQAIIRIPGSDEQYGAADFRRIGGVAGP